MGCNNYFDMTDQGDSFESWQGLRGPAGPQGTPGAPGSSVELKGPVATTGDLPASAPASELWQVGTQAPYNGYFFNGTSWVNLGPVAAGATFLPAVSSDGVISWTNDGGLPNPESVNIKGPQGQTGPDGVSPEVTIAQISGGHSVTITDADHPQGQQFDVMDGQTGATGPAGPGVPAGGSAGRVLRKQSATDYDTAWEKEDLGIIGASVYDFVQIHGVSNGKPTVFGRISDPNTNVGIVQNLFTATQNISKGQYVIWRGALYTASAEIASGATLSSSNLTAMTGGGLNDVKNLIPPDFRNITLLYQNLGSDLDDIHGDNTTGLYYIGADVPNSPRNYAMMLVISRAGSTGFATQLVMGGNEICIRSFMGTPPAWTVWKRFN